MLVRKRCITLNCKLRGRHLGQLGQRGRTTYLVYISHPIIGLLLLRYFCDKATRLSGFAWPGVVICRTRLRNFFS